MDIILQTVSMKQQKIFGFTSGQNNDVAVDKSGCDVTSSLIECVRVDLNDDNTKELDSDNVSTTVNIDNNELPTQAKIRIFFTKFRRDLACLTIILIGSLTTIISVNTASGSPNNNS